MRTRDPDKSRRTILHAAETEFAKNGFWGARVDDIAAAAQINKRMIYAYFGDKEGLYKQVLFTVYGRMERVDQEVAACQYTGERLVREIISAYFDFLQANHTVVSILMWENLNQGKYLKQLDHTRIERGTIQYFVDELEKGKVTGIFRKDADSWHTVLSLITVCFANFSNQYTLSKLFGRDLTDPTLIEQRKLYTADMMVSYLCNKH